MKNKKLLTGMLATVLSVSMLCSNANMLQAQETTETTQVSEVVEETNEETTEVMQESEAIAETSEESAEAEDAIIPNDETGIPDTNLYNAILKTADRNKDEVLTVSEAELVTGLWARDAGIQDLQGIQYCKNLEGLFLGNSEGSDGENNEVSDISPLAGMTQLGNIELSNNQIEDISALTGKENLWSLELSYNPLNENAIDIIANIVSICDLSLAGTELTNEDVKKLANLDVLKGFDFSDNQISDISPLNNIWEYVYLVDLSNNQISDVSILSGLGGSACEFNLSNNQISDVTPVVDFKAQYIDLSNNQIGDITPLTDYSGYSLNLSNNQISELVHFEVIHYLDLSGNQITDISPLMDVEDFFSGEDSGLFLNLSNNKITDITPIIYAESILSLDLSNNQISDITSLGTVELTKLTILDLSNNNIRDISVLDSWKEKENPCEIITAGNPIGEPEPEQPEEDIPSEDETPSEPTEPENPSEDETPSEPTEPENPSEDETPSKPTEPQKPSKPIYNTDDFAELLETQDIVVKPNDYVTITFEKGSKLNDTNGKTEFDFTTTITTDFTNAKLPTFITENSFITKVSYTYSGVLPSTANIKIFVGTEYAGKEVFYFLLNEDGTFNKDEVQKVKVNEDGSIIVTQEHCSDYVVTTENPETLYKATQTPEQPKDENTSNNNANNNTIKEESPKTSDNSQFVLLSLMMISLSAFVVLARKIYKRA